MNRWFRFYDGVLDDPKVQRLPPALFKAWVNLMCLASRNNGNIPTGDVAFALRVSDQEAVEIVDQLVAAELVDEFDGLFAPHNWDARQFKSDTDDPTAAERMRRYRSKHRNGNPSSDRNGDRNATVTVTVPRDRADTEQNRTEDITELRSVTRKRTPSPKKLLPDDWQPEGDLNPNEQWELKKMRDWAKAGAIRRADWNAQWRNWLRNTGNFQRSNHGTTQGNDFKRALGRLADSIGEDSGGEETRAPIVRLLPGGRRE